MRGLSIAFTCLAVLTPAVAGAAPPSTDDQRRIAAEVQNLLKDGESARFRWPDVERDPAVYCGWVNAKNSYGGYTGYELYMAVIQRTANAITSVTVNFDRTTAGDRFVPESCAHFGYQIGLPPSVTP